MNQKQSSGKSIEIEKKSKLITMFSNGLWKRFKIQDSWVLKLHNYRVHSKNSKIKGFQKYIKKRNVTTLGASFQFNK